MKICTLLRDSCLIAMVFMCIATRSFGQTGIVPLVGQSAPNTTSGGPALVQGNGINYHGGPVIINPHDVYFIWYGNWSGNSALSILPAFITGLNGSPYFNTNTTYANGNGQNIVNSVAMSGQVFDSYSQGTTLSDQGLQTAILHQLQSGALPTDSNGIYFVLTSADVDEKGSSGEFCVQFCGFHNHATLNGTDIKFSFVGNIQRCPSACAASNIGSGPNGNLGADAMANVMAHELNETVTDPDLNAWFDSNGQEVGDKCNFNFGPEFTTANGAPADVTLGGKNFLIQQNWVNANGGFCGMSFGTPPPPPPPAPSQTPAIIELIMNLLME